MDSNKNKHEHHNCEHDIEFCAPCNEAYCIKCDLVFIEPCTLQHTNWTWTTTPDFSTGTDTVPYTITTTYPDTIGDVIVDNDGMHSTH